MSVYPYRALFVWIAILALAWLVLCSPWSTAWNVVLAILVIAGAVAAIVTATRRIRARHHIARGALAAIDAALGSVPEDVKRNTPLVLVIGNAPDKETDGVLAGAFGAELVRVTDTAIWVRCDEPMRLMQLADALKRWRDGQGPDAVAYLIAADQIDSEASSATGLKRWRSAIDQACRAVGYRLPVCIAIYAGESRYATEACPWFGISGDSPVRIGTLPMRVTARAAQYTCMATPPFRELRAHRSAQLESLARWACMAILPKLVGMERGSVPLKITAFGVTVIEARPAPASLFGQFVLQATGLALAGPRDIKPSYPLPEPLIGGIPRQPVRHALPHALAHAVVWLAACFCAAAAASSWQNRALFEHLLGDISRYQAIAPTRDAARIDALKALKRDRDELEHYARSGVPPRLGLGFYRSAALLPLIHTLIAGYQPPAAPPSAIELDSLSLFNTGSAVLNPGSNRVLVGALEMIEAHPDKRVLVAGHTDSVGDRGSNLKLSEARAASVRNWLADASGIPSSHFAIQGYGDTRPKDPNDTAAGRAANRRVEITLVPDCRDDSEGHVSPPGHPACSFK